MSSILRQIVAGPRLQHPEAGLDLCYVTDNKVSVIATSGPSATYPQRAYRNPLDALVSFLDSKHGANWSIWEFRAEGTGYPDSEVYGRIHHFPWPDHHPPPFALIPNIMGSMRNWMHRLEDKDGSQPGERVAVVHCKAGKGRSGTVATAYLISQEGWKKEEALQRFTDRRMRVGFGAGVSIPSQLRYVDYIDRWTNKLDKQYVERPVEILEVHIWGLRDGVKVAIEGYVDEGKKVKCFHMFHRSERTVIESGNTTPTKKQDGKEQPSPIAVVPSSTWSPMESSQSDSSGGTPTSDLARRSTVASNDGLSAVIFRPKQSVIVPGSDVNIDFERRSKAAYTGFAMVTSVAHVWFNAYFEGGHQHDSGVFETEWDAMDGIKGSARKGIRALERLKVVWRYPTPPDSGPQKPDAKDTTAAAVSGRPISEPKPGEPIHESHPADWRGQLARDQEENTSPTQKENTAPDTNAAPHTATTATASATGATLVPSDPETLQRLERQLGIRQQTDESKDVSLAGSEDEGRSTTDDEGRTYKVHVTQKSNGNGDLEGVQPYFGKNDTDEGKDVGSDSKDNAAKAT
ncbi:Phosphatase tensin type [Penicillium capsulatum]|uniref:phosphatidylinositol-3,4,5-trisphosphate 3-phosphatase n=1 Tax=Penicillium capsulatum TaxID=69766 RepID=A0A9W9LQW1_9EURO|nr:Phosphatase tensin type [Penicillium capsulatum]KAJ6135571.1 Phosphatase tensin type [Penicillium capsulatum]